VYVGQPVTFIVTPHGSGNVIRNSLVYEWNFGDLYTGTSSSPQHTYQYSGTYTVVVRGTFANTSALARQSVTVLPVTISVAHTANGDVLLHNDALYEIDISAYYLTGTKTKKIPKHTYVAPRETITVPWQMVSERAFPEVAVYGPSKALITTSSSGGHIAQPNNAGLNYTAAVTEPELFVPVVSQPLVTEVPVSTNGSPAFGFSSTALPLGTSTAEVVEGSTEDKALLPLALVSDTRSSDALPVAPTPWGIYGMFVLLLIGAVMGIFIRPQQTSKHESDLKI
jgi:PKD repeat protein